MEASTETIEQENGSIKFPLDLNTSYEWLGSDEMLEAIKTAKPEAEEGDENAPKLQALAKGFMFQANKPMVGNDPFYIESHLIGENQYAVSANRNGLLSRADIKALRKALKGMLNQEKEEFNVEGGGTTQYDDGGYDDYYDEGPDF